MFFHAEPELAALLEQFYILTGIRISVRDEKLYKVLAYPAEPTNFCGYMRGSDNAFDKKCADHENRVFGRCRREKKLVFFHCHAGLTGAAAPLMMDDRVVGYMIMMQFSDHRIDEGFVREVMEYCEQYRTYPELEEHVRKIKYKKQAQIVAAAKIMEAITSYILQKEMIRPQKKELFDRLRQYVETHLNENISVDGLCEYFHVSRTHLYSALEGRFSGGIAEFVREKRLSAARKLLKGSDIPISEISQRVGFSDYNYFLRVFKKRYGISPKTLRRG